MKRLCDPMKSSLNLSRCDANMMSHAADSESLVFTTPSDEASWAARVIFFKVDVSCRLSGVLTEWFSGMFTPQELLASQSCHWHLCLFLRLLLLLGLNDVAKGKKGECRGRWKNKVLTAEKRLAALLHILRAEPQPCVCTRAVAVICLIVESKKTVWKTVKWVKTLHWSAYFK